MPGEVRPKGKLHKRSAEAPAIDARSGQASESTNEAHDVRGCRQGEQYPSCPTNPSRFLFTWHFDDAGQ